MLHEGKIAEMKTGEGKTSRGDFAALFKRLTGRGVHLITVNDYLARRDVQWMGPIFDKLGLSIASIVHEASYLFDPAYYNQGLSLPESPPDHTPRGLPRGHHLWHQ